MTRRWQDYPPIAGRREVRGVYDVRNPDVPAWTYYDGDVCVGRVTAHGVYAGSTSEYSAIGSWLVPGDGWMFYPTCPDGTVNEDIQARKGQRYFPRHATARAWAKRVARQADGAFRPKGAPRRRGGA